MEFLIFRDLQVSESLPNFTVINRVIEKQSWTKKQNFNPTSITRNQLTFSCYCCFCCCCWRGRNVFVQLFHNFVPFQTKRYLSETKRISKMSDFPFFNPQTVGEKFNIVSFENVSVTPSCVCLSVCLHFWPPLFVCQVRPNIWKRFLLSKKKKTYYHFDKQ